MINENQFISALREVEEIAKTSDHPLSKEEVHAYFRDMELTKEQERMVYEYLLHPMQQNAVPENEEKKQENSRETDTDSRSADGYSKTVSLADMLEDMKNTPEEIAEKIQREKDQPLENLSSSVHYKEYLHEAQARVGDNLDLDELYRALPTEDATVLERIMNAWLIRIIQLAGEYNDGMVNPEDLIQEGNMVVWMQLSAVSGPVNSDEMDKRLQEAAAEAMKECIREAAGTKDRENAAVGRVSLVYEAQKYLLEENGELPSFRELSEYTHIPPEEIADIMALIDEGKEKPEKK